MEDTVKQAGIISNKVRRITDQYSLLQARLNSREDEITQLKRENEQLQLSIKELKEKIVLQKIAKTTEKREGSVDAKLKINELIREIDRCIGLLQV
ncbi:MAG: hypothetical protein WCL00_16175 [Bacteroidota bacterium]